MFENEPSEVLTVETSEEAALEESAPPEPTNRREAFELAAKGMGDDDEDDSDDQPADTEEVDADEEDEEPGTLTDTDSAPTSDEDKANAEEQLILGKYESQDKFIEGHKNLEAEAGRLARENAELRKQLKEDSSSVSAETDTSTDEEPLDESLIDILVNAEDPAKAEAALRARLLEGDPVYQKMKAEYERDEAAKEFAPYVEKYDDFEDFVNTAAPAYIESQVQAVKEGKITEQAFYLNLSAPGVEAEYLRQTNAKLKEAAKNPKPPKKQPKEVDTSKVEKAAAASSAKGKGAGETIPVEPKNRAEAFELEFQRQKANKR